MFDIQAEYDPVCFFVEDGVIWKSAEPYLLLEMRKCNIFLNTIPMLSIKDKATNGRSLQKRMQAHAVESHKKNDWYAGNEHELLRLTDHSGAALDDPFDSG